MSPRSLALALLAGALLGVVSRLTDIAAWAPTWFGYVLTPWLAAAWLAGASAPNPRAGAARGLALLLTTVAAYVAFAATDAATLAQRLLPVALLAGPIFGAAGATWRAGARYARPAGALLGASVVAESLLLQLGPHAASDRLLFAGESLLGIGLLIGLAAWARRWPGTGEDGHPEIVA